MDFFKNHYKVISFKHNSLPKTGMNYIFRGFNYELSFNYKLFKIIIFADRFFIIIYINTPVI